LPRRMAHLGLPLAIVTRRAADWRPDSEPFLRD
jgi:hypothetical protein